MLDQLHRALTVCALRDYFGKEVYKQDNQVTTKQTMTSLPGGMRLSLNLRELGKEGQR